MESFQEAFEEIRFEAEGFFDAGADIVVATRMRAVAKLTRIPVEQRNAAVWTVLDGKIVLIQTFATLSEALRAAGLPEVSE
jgi:ketosteroid isomerase-like protein